MSRHIPALLTALALASLLGCDSKKSADAPKNTDTKADASASTPETSTAKETPPADATKEEDAKTKDGAGTGAAASSGATVKQLPYNDKAPAGVEMKFPVTHALGWQDKNGENALVFAQQVRTEGGKSIQELQVRHARRSDKGSDWETVRDFKELVTGCDGTAVIEVVTSAWEVSDLDKDGVGEATFAYSAGCRITDQVPLKHKVLMIEDGEKYALRGKSEVYDDKTVAVDAAGNKFGKTIGGDFTADPAFKKAPAGFEAHAEKVWKASVMEEDRGEPSANAEIPAGAPDGEYLDTHKVLADADTEEMADVTDCFSVWTFEDGSIEFGLELNFDLDHSCAMHGEAKPRSGSWAYEGSKETDDEGCVLWINFTKDYIELKDKTGDCREVWCGMRGNLDGTRFPLKNKRADTQKCGR